MSAALRLAPAEGAPVGGVAELRVVRAFGLVAAAANDGATKLDALRALLGRTLAELLDARDCAVHLGAVRRDGARRGAVQPGAARSAAARSGAVGDLLPVGAGREIVVEMMAGGDVVGVLQVVGDRAFGEHDLQLAEAFAALAATAVQQVRGRERAARRDRASALRRAAHDALAAGASITDLIAAAARHLDRPLALHDRTTMIASAGTWPTLPALSPTLLARLDGGADHAVVPGTPPLLHHAVRGADGEVLGVLLTTGTGADLLGELAPVVGLRWELDRGLRERDDARRAEFAADLLLGRRPAAQLDAPAHGIDPAERHAVLVLDGASEEFVAALRRAASGSLRFVAEAALDGRRQLVVTPQEPCRPAELVARVRAAFDTAADTTGERPSGVLGDLCGALGELAGSLRRASGVLDLVGEDRQFAVAAHLDALRLAADPNGWADLRRTAAQVLAPLVEQELLPTLAAYARTGGTRAAAVELGVHENTVRYRLARIAAISAIDPASPPDLLRAQLLVQAHELPRSVAAAGRRDRAHPLPTAEHR